MTRFLKSVIASVLMAASAVGGFAQSGNVNRGGNLEGTLLTVTASRTDGKTEAIKVENLSRDENWLEHKNRNFSFDPSASMTVDLIDNSQTIGADVEKLKKATMEFAYEIFDGDQLFVLAYDEKAEIIQEWTDDAKKT